MSKKPTIVRRKPTTGPFASDAPSSQPAGSRAETESPQQGFFPLARYTSIVGVHASLLGFAVLFLPRTSLLLFEFEERKTDRPQHEFLETLTISPVLTLAWICLGVIILQVWWAGWMRGWSIDYVSRGTYAEHKVHKTELNKHRLAELSKAFAFTFATSLVYHVVIVLFGAPIASHMLHTYLLACLLAFLTVLTPSYVLGYPSLAKDAKSFVGWLTWIRLFVEMSPRNSIERAMVYPAIGALIGCWLGAIPIPLDWDRPWQAWPLTPMLGAVSGYVLGSLSALLVSATSWLAEEDIRSVQISNKAS